MIFRLVHNQARERALEAVMTAPEGYCVTVKPETRNTEQNAALHALLTDIANLEGFGMKTWRCPKCGHENELVYYKCWWCGHEVA